MNRSPYVILKWVLIAAAIAGVLYVAGVLARQGNLIAVIVVGMVGLTILLIYGTTTKRAMPLKYLFPGLILLIGLQIWPAVYTAATSFTNWGDGHSLTKVESIKAITSTSVEEVAGKARYPLSVAVPEGDDATTGDLVYLLVDPQSKKAYSGTLDGLKELPAADVTLSPLGRITAAKGFTVLTAKQVNSRSKDLADFAVPTQGGAAIKIVGLSEGFEGKPLVTYDAATDALTDSRPVSTGGQVKTFVPRDASWVNKDNPDDRLPTGWKENVGFRNFSDALTNETLRNGFLGILLWNLVFAVVSVLSTFLLGLALALLFNDPRLKGKGLMRAVLILPYALPGFVTALVWAAMFNQQFGLINETLGLSTDWLGNGLAAKAAILVTNLWLGFPYMFIVCTGALQSIPTDVKEAAAIDGATGLRTVRSIIMPLVLVAVGPLLVASFAFNFNNFTLIFLMTEGGPFEGGQSTVGSTDLLITYAYRLAFSGTAPKFGFAAAISILIFFLVAIIAWVGFRQTKALEEVN